MGGLEMKKVALAMILVFMLLAGCSGNNTGPTNAGGETKSGFDSKKASLGEGIYVEKESRNGLEKLNLKVEDYLIVQDQSEQAEDNEKYDYVQMKLTIENVGDVEVSHITTSREAFDFYDHNGKEVEGYIYKFIGQTYEAANLRPGGKNEGVVLFAIPKGVVPAEMVYNPSWAGIKRSHEYVFDLKQ